MIISDSENFALFPNCRPALKRYTNNPENMGDNFGIHRGGARANASNTNGTAASSSTAAASSSEDRTQGQVLSDFLLQLEDYTPTVSARVRLCL